MMPQFELEFTVMCNTCNGNLTAHALNIIPHVLQVEPCENCLQDARNDGYESGHRDYEEEQE